MSNRIGSGLSPQVAQLLNSVINQPQSAFPGTGFGAPAMDPLSQLQQLLGQMQGGGAQAADPRMLRRVIRNLDRQIVERLLGGGLTGGTNPLSALGGNPMAQGIPTGFGTTSLSNCFPGALQSAFPQAAAQNPQLCAPPPVCAQPAQPAPLPEIKGTHKGGWLAAHGKYKKEKDGSYTLPDGRKVIPVEGQKGQFTVQGPDGQPQGIFNAPKGQDKIASPLSFDLNGDGKVSTTGVQDGKKFDINGDGKVDQTAWAGKGDGVLAFGNAASGKELLGNNTDLGDGKKHANGFEALRALADKYTPGASADGKLDERELAVLQQKAGLSMIVDGQRKGLADVGVKEINLGYTEAGQNADQNGNEHRQVGAGFVRNNGQTGKVNDVWFKYA